MIRIDFLGDITSKDKDIYEQVARESLNTLGVFNANLEIWFSTIEEIKTLNQEYRKIDKPTDVLSFPQIITGRNNEHLGSIVISKEMVNQKNENMNDVIKHGILHLIGLDHEVDQDKWDSVAKKIKCSL